jgi:protein-S-isoprenylcysteine O-methyltransferase Ste14
MSDAFDKSIAQDSRSVARVLLANQSVPARASVVNRTHRVVRERAKTMAARRSRFRSLWIPMAVCSSLLVIICTAVWSVLDAYEVTPSGVPDASNQFLVLCLWFLPVSMALLAVVLFQRARKREAAQ